MISARLTPAVRLKFAGAEWRIVVTHDVLLGLEEMTGADVLGGGIDPWCLSAADMRALLYLTLRGAGSSLSILQVSGFLLPHEISVVHAAIRGAWMAAMPEAAPSRKESAGKKLTWPEAYASARVDLGLTEDEWLGMTPRVLQALFKRRAEAMKREAILHGMKPEKEPSQQKPLTGEDIIAAMGGKSYMKG